MFVVAKFGGSSLASAEQFKKVKGIVSSSDVRNIVVVSAAGKRNKADSKLTDLLFLLHAHLRYSVPYENVWNLIETRFLDIKKELDLKIDIKQELEELKSTLSKDTNEDFLVSRGEYFTARLMSEYLGYQFVDAKDLILFNYDGTLNQEKTKEAVNIAFKKYGKMIVPGFYGA